MAVSYVLHILSQTCVCDAETFGALSLPVGDFLALQHKDFSWEEAYEQECSASLHQSLHC